MLNGVFYDGIETDPRDSRDADEKYDLKTLSQYKGLSSQKTMLSSKGRNTMPISTKVEKYVDKMIEKAQEAKARVAARKKAQQEEASEAPKGNSKLVGR